MQILAYYALAAQGFAFPARCGYKHCRSYAARCVSSALRLSTPPQPCVALPFRCGTSRCYSGAFHCFALPRFALSKRTVSLPCTAFLLPCCARPGGAFSCRGLSVPGFSGAYPLGPLPAPISVLGEELPDPALGIEWEPLCPGRGLAHDAPYILEVCLRCVGMPLDDHLVVDVEDHPVSGLLEVV